MTGYELFVACRMVSMDNSEDVIGEDAEVSPNTTTINSSV